MREWLNCLQLAGEVIHLPFPKVNRLKWSNYALHLRIQLVKLANMITQYVFAIKCRVVRDNNKLLRNYQYRYRKT